MIVVTCKYNIIDGGDGLLWKWGLRLIDFFFFFQAEDGIRDYKVTGVQTCALPICGLGK